MQHEKAIERGEIVVLRRVPFVSNVIDNFDTVLPPPPGSPDLGLTSPTSIQPTDTFVRPKRRHRSRRPKVVISPPSIADSPPQTPFPPLVPPNPPPSPLPPPLIVSDSANIAPPVCPTSSSKSSSIPSKLSATATTFVPTAVAAKKQSYFERFSAVRQVIGDAMSRATFSFAEFRRKLCRHTVFDDDVTEPAPASSMKVREMFDEEFCGHGNLPLPEGTVALNLESMDKYHVMSCVDCSVEGRISDDCYWSKLRLCVSCGMKPQLVPGSSGSPTPQYEGSGSEGNHASASYAFPTYTKSQIDKLLARGAIEKCSPKDISVSSPLGVTVPSSRRRQTKTLTGIDARDDASYEAAEAALAVQGYSKVLKRRLVYDMRASGFNNECAYLPFRYVNIGDAIELVTKDCYFASCDVDSYYYFFPMAEEFRHFLGFMFEGEYFRFTSPPFGMGPAPRLASTFTAENVQSIKAQGAPCVAMIDDFLTIGKDIDEALHNQHIMESTLTNNGFMLSEAKRVGPVQQAVFIGVRLDSVNMTQSVNPASADLFKNSLEVYIEILEQGGALSRDVTRHLCGVLENWAQLCQEGRDRSSLCWQYLCHGSNLWPACRLHLLEDLRWWLEKAALWATGDADGCYPLVTGAYLAEHPESVHVSVTDFSGTDGIGGITGLLTASNPEYFSENQDDSTRGVSSFVGELTALLRVLQEEEAKSLDLTRAQPSVPVLVEVWLTDSASAASSVNSGRCSDESGRVLLHEIFAIAARLRRTLLAIWIPREFNTDADNLSHYAALLGVSQTQGHLSDLPSWVARGFAEASSQGGGETDRVQAKCEGSEGALQPLQRLPGDVQPGDGFRRSGNVPDPFHAGKQWAHGFSEYGTEPPAEAAREERTAVPIAFGECADQGADRSLSQGGPTPGASSPCFAHGHRAGDYQDYGFVGPSAAYQGNPIAYGSPVPSPCWGNHQFPPGGGFCFQDQRACGGYSYPSHQNLYDWGGSVCGIGGQRQRGIGVQAVGAHVRRAWAPQENHRVRVLYDSKGSALPQPTVFERGFQRAH